MFKILALTLVLSTIGAITAEMYIPSLPYIAASFHVNHSLIQYSLTFYMLGTIVPALFLGALADIYGRKRIIVISLLVGLSGTLGCLFAKSIGMFIFCRFIQGLAFSSTNGLGRALLRDYYKGEQFAKYSSYLSMGFALSVDLTPFVGGVFQKLFNWHSIFVFLFLFNLMSLSVALKFPFKKIREKQSFNFRRMFVNYLVICKNLKFQQYNIIAACTYSVFMSYLSVAAFLWETRLHVSPDGFGLITLLLSGCYVGSCYLNSRIVRFGLNKVLRLGLLLTLAAGVVLLVSGIDGYVSRLDLFFTIGLFFIGSGLVFANSSAMAMSSITDNFSSASALYSFTSIVVGALFSAIINLFDATNVLPLAIIIIFLALSSLVMELFPKFGLKNSSSYS